MGIALAMVSGYYQSRTVESTVVQVIDKKRMLLKTELLFPVTDTGCGCGDPY